MRKLILSALLSITFSAVSAYSQGMPGVICSGGQIACVIPGATVTGSGTSQVVTLPGLFTSGTTFQVGAGVSTAGGGLIVGTYGSTAGGLWSNGVTPSTSNYILNGSSNAVAINAPASNSNLYFSIADATTLNLNRAGASPFFGPFVDNSTVSGGDLTHTKRWLYVDSPAYHSGATVMTFATSSGDATALTIATTGAIQFNRGYGSGAVTSDASGNLTITSDERLKDLQGDYGAGLAEILKINPILYKWNELSGMETAHTYAGFSAQNVRSAIPLYGTGETVGDSRCDGGACLTLQDRAILAAMVNAIKEQNKRIEALEKK